jgi:hypothetical protein
MDPFLEDPDIFPDFQHSFIVYLSELMQPVLKTPYRCRIGQRVWFELPHDERREPFVEIYVGRRADRRTVTIVELLSLTTKTPGEEGRDLYLRRRRELLASEVNLVEIDLQRGGRYTLAVPKELLDRHTGDHDYRIAVHTLSQPDRFAVYPLALEERMPVVALPLLPEDDAVALDLQAVFERCYDAAQYAREIAYRPDALLSLEPPLSTLQMIWARQLLQT